MTSHLRRWKQKNNSVIDLGKLLIGVKGRSSLTDKEIYEYLKNHHVPMKGDTLFKKLVTRKSSSFFLSFKMKWFEENPWLVYSKELEGALCLVSCSMKKIRIEAYSLKEPFKMSVNLRRLESMSKQNITMKT